MARRNRGMFSMILIAVVLSLAGFGIYTLYQTPTGQKVERVTKAAVKAGSQAVDTVSAEAKKPAKRNRK